MLQKFFILAVVFSLGLSVFLGAQQKKRNLLVIGQSKGYQHEAVSSAMATLYNLGRSSGLWDTSFRTDCAPITKKPLKWGARNLDAYDAIVFYTDGDLDMDESQKADLLSFIREDGKGFIGIHSATITHKPSGIVPISRRCGLKWFNGRWAWFQEMPRRTRSLQIDILCYVNGTLSRQGGF